MITFLRQIRRAVFLLAWIFGVWLILLLLKWLGLRQQIKALLPFYHHGILYFLGVRLRFYGKICEMPVVYCANHASWLDIMVLGSAVKGSFVAKKELRNWVGLGPIFEIQETIFIDRLNKKGLLDVQNAMKNILKKKQNVILFPEGTTGDGNRALPFNSSLMAIFEDKDMSACAQAISIAYVQVDGAVAGRLLRPHFSWVGNQSLIAHAWRLLGHGRSVIEVIFHEPVRLAQGENRKQLTKRLYDQVAKGLEICYHDTQDKPARIAYAPMIESAPFS